jgi:hypothetical protein
VQQRLKKSLRPLGATLALLAAASAFAGQQLPTFPGVAHTRIGNDLAIAGRYFRLAYFTTPRSVEQVAEHFAREFEEQGYPTFVDGDLDSEAVVSAFMTREGLIKSVVVRRHGEQSLGFSVLKDLWLQAPTGHGLEALPRLEGALFHDALSFVDKDGRSGQRTQILQGQLPQVRAEVVKRMGSMGFKPVREGAVRQDGKQQLVIEYARAGEQVVTVLSPMDEGVVAVHQTWVGSDRPDAVPNDRALEQMREKRRKGSGK